MHYLGPGLDLLFTDETLLDTRRAERAGGDVAARSEQRVPLHVRAHHALLQGLVVAVERRATRAHLPTERHGERGKDGETRDERKEGSGKQRTRGERGNKRGTGMKENMADREDR